MRGRIYTQSREDIDMWQTLAPGEQARLRYSLMRELSWIDWDNRPRWWWRAEHTTLLTLKAACGKEEPHA